MSQQTLAPLPRLQGLLTRYFCAHNCARNNAHDTAAALIRAEVDGKTAHGLTRASAYAAQAQSGKVNGGATPTLQKIKPAAARIDAACGFAYPALNMAKNFLAQAAQEHGVAVAAVFRSHHCGVAGHAAEDLANANCMAFLFANTSAALPAFGGKTPLFGTNPIAFAAPVAGEPPLVADFAASVAARGKIVRAARAGKPIPAGWALDSNGKPTTNAQDALAGCLLPAAGAKGAALALVVEALAGALAGAALSCEASSFLDNAGAPPQTGQLLLAIDARLFAANAGERLAELAQKMRADGGRMPGENRQARRQKAAAQGIAVDPAWLAEISAAAAKC